MSGRNSLALTAVVTFASALVLFIVDTEVRISAVNERMEAGFAEIGKSAELSSMMQRSVLGSELLTEFLHDREPGGRAGQPAAVAARPA